MEEQTKLKTVLFEEKLRSLNSISCILFLPNGYFDSSINLLVKYRTLITTAKVVAWKKDTLFYVCSFNQEVLNEWVIIFCTRVTVKSTLLTYSRNQIS